MAFQCLRAQEQVLEGQGFAPLERAYRRLWLHEQQQLHVASGLQAKVPPQVLASTPCSTAASRTCL